MKNIEVEVFITGIFCGVIITAIGMTILLNAVWRGDSVRQGYAEYNSYNGNWQWKTNIIK